MKAILALALAGALLIPTTAQAKDLPPGYTSNATLEDAPLPAAMKDCAHCRAKLLRWHLRKWNGDVVDKHNVKLAVGARNGQVFWSNVVRHRWDDPGDKPWSFFGALQNYGGDCCGGGRYAHSTSNWAFHGPGGVDNYWTTDLHIKAHVGGPGRGPNDIWFSKWSSFG